jgi:hypothetical protein
MCWLKTLCYIPWDLYYIFARKSLVFIKLHHKFHGSRLSIIVVQNLFFIGSYGVNMNVIHLFALFEHWYCVHCLDTYFNAYLYCLNMDVVCLFMLFMPKNFAHDFLCLNNACHSCVNNINLWNNKFHTNLEWTYEVC